MQLIPQQRMMVNQLLRDGIITGYALSSDRTTLWITCLGKSTKEVRAMIREFPLYKYMREEITELMFHEQARYALPEVSLN